MCEHFITAQRRALQHAMPKQNSTGRTESIVNCSYKECSLAAVVVTQDTDMSSETRGEGMCKLEEERLNKEKGVKS